VTVTVVVSVRLPLVALTVMVWVPVDAFLEVATVIFEVPEPVMEVGLKVTVSPLPCPVADRLIAELRVPVTEVVIVELPELPLVIDKEVGEAETVKDPVVAEVTVSETVVVSTVLPLVPLTVMV
jgi:hypothetical protein